MFAAISLMYKINDSWDTLAEVFFENSVNYVGRMLLWHPSLFTSKTPFSGL